MTPKSCILILALLLFNSCILKSLQPFYTPESLHFNDSLVGHWKDHKKGTWTVTSIASKIEAEANDSPAFQADLKLLETYKKGYYITHVTQDKAAIFIAMPFKVNGYYFLDFIPVEVEDDELNSLAAAHLLKTHSVAKLNIDSDTNVTLTWLSEKRIKALFEGEQIRLKHEIIGIQEDLLITASSEELYAFLKKYTNANLFNAKEKSTNKWNSSDQLLLTKVNATP